MGNRKTGCFFLVKKFLLTIMLVVLLLTAGMAAYNFNQPKATEHPAVLAANEQVRIAESMNVRKRLGNKVWPGWGDVTIPVLLYNEQYAFLTGLQNPAEGWKRVPYSTIHGKSWELVDSPTPYYRQPLPETGETPQAFIVQIGDSYVASMTTKAWTKIHLSELIKQDVPDFLKPIVPYQLFTSKFNSDWHIASILHESFHALQAHRAYPRLVDAEKSALLESTYPWHNADFRNAWVQERQLLARALSEKNPKLMREDIRKWLTVRAQRRASIDSSLIYYEKQREWLEGMAKYAEINIWMQAANQDLYHPIAGLEKDHQFSFYQNAKNQREQEIRQLKSDLGFSESMLYYSGWAQCELLDRLNVNWKSLIFEPGMFLDDLIRESLTAPPVVQK